MSLYEPFRLRNAETLKCVDPADLDPSMLELQDCQMHLPNTAARCQACQG